MCAALRYRVQERAEIIFQYLSFTWQDHLTWKVEIKGENGDDSLYFSVHPPIVKANIAILVSCKIE